MVVVAFDVVAGSSCCWLGYGDFAASGALVLGSDRVVVRVVGNPLWTGLGPAGCGFVCIAVGLVSFGVTLFSDSNDRLMLSSWRAFRLRSISLWSKTMVSKSSESLS